ncbi:MAG: tyrosine-type recombinase/integrase [Burkholderiales bacterium]
MARTVRDSNLESRDARLRLKRGARHWKGIYAGVAISYRRGAKGSGTWSVRLLAPTGKYTLAALGVADDYVDANGVNVLSYRQANDRAREKGEEARRSVGGINPRVTLKEAANDYLTWFRAQKKGVAMTESAIRAHILPAFGDREIATIKTHELRSWLEKLATKPARLRTSRFASKANLRPAPKSGDEKRARKASANRIYSVLRALLNRAFQSGAIADDSAWRKVKPFKKVDEARIRFLTDAECVRLVNACPPDLRALVRAALLTGARWGELAALQVSDVVTNTDRPRVYVAETKSDRPRHIPLNAEGGALFSAQTTGKTGDALVFVRADGGRWGHNHHVRALNEACRVAKIRPAVTFHELRHTYASHLAQAGIDLLTISKLLGHADTRITARHYAHLADKTLAAAVTYLPSFAPDKQRVIAEVKGTRAA